MNNANQSDARTPNPLSRGPHAALFIAAGCSHRIKTGWQRTLPTISPTAAIIGSGRCQSCPRPLPTEKAWLFSRLVMRTSQFAHTSLPIALRLSISHTNVSHFCGSFLRNDYPARSDWGAAEVFLVRKTDKNKKNGEEANPSLYRAERGRSKSPGGATEYRQGHRPCESRQNESPGGATEYPANLLGFTWAMPSLDD